MQPRQNNYFKLAEPGFKHVFALESALKNGPLEPKLLHLVKLRASQINSCVFCIHLHTTEALKDGEDPMRLYLLTGWREATLYSSRERAALAWTEALTNLAQTGAPDDDWGLVEAAFTAEERSWLSLAIGAINLWNRLQVGFRATHPA
ncbi:carboxymuconolactone decarboxylase family protein [Sinorhizobium numidicum]|uniref:Carboxymuconolactone decarboxylase family protein n=1 Tax=Sinorhizobium numidicum TaxID=680248 RepID=A0ABY8CT72_9HYPH|nr:carboxymuconolactone decarboxylase family protein [Sinorhizobium numidicum]WEX74680.1 carboxymuconolactone decarboxylase family protein [Sinorhizobium numidicum]WEX80672.1 carboxymuconolactone decarboxylase family protein [Sinorhizobium numidicum]